jgi:hypothetical protein
MNQKNQPTLLERSIDWAGLKRPFPPEDIEWRISRSGYKDGKPWAKVLAYVTARAIMDRLDECVGPEHWQVSYSHLESKGVMCLLSINTPSHGWITKEDGAQETEFEPFKGGISSSLKRAGVTVGIGRYLYNLEEGWADISEKKSPGARYARIKDASGEGQACYWKPPPLPTWALPKGFVSIKEALPAIPPPAPGLDAPEPSESDKKKRADYVLALAQAQAIEVKMREARARPHLANIIAKHANSLKFIDEHAPKRADDLRALWVTLKEGFASVPAPPPNPEEEQ